MFSFLNITERKKFEDQLLYQSTYHDLTALPNRILLTDRLQQAIAQARRLGVHAGVLFLDLDNFKQVNDTLGHYAGDILLRNAARKIKSYLRETDTVARWGGDEFVIVFASIPKEEALTVIANKLLKAFSTPWFINQNSFSITISMGISVYPKDGEDSSTLLKNADAALYRAKESGRNTFRFYQEEFNKQMLKKSELTADLSQAIKNHELILYYQPLFDLQTRKIIGAEALLRWNHPTRGTIGPDVFIPLAESTGLIVSIGEWVLKVACLQAKEWHETISPQLTMAVNISPYQFMHPEFVKLVEKTLIETGFESRLLELEITESLILGDPAEVSEKMDSLKKIGVRFSVDDFGTGYASFSYIKYFAFDKIKIDKSFIAGISRNTDDKTIVKAIISMTRTLGLTALAEGLESKEQLDFLQTHHSNQVQGYYFSPPVDREKFAEVFQRFSRGSEL